MNFQQARQNMVAQQVRPWNVLDTQVLEVLLDIHRENFVEAAYRQLAYSDTDLPLPQDQSLLAPKVVGRALQALKIKPTDNILEVGTGSGYVTACLAKLGRNVISLEILPTLLAMAQKNLSQSACKNATLIQADGVFGYVDKGPYDVIMITGAYPLGVPQAICEQLTIGGRLFAFCGQTKPLEAVLIERKNQNDYTSQSLFETWVSPLMNAPVASPFHF